MPHIRAIFIEDINVQKLLRFEKTAIRVCFAHYSGYDLEQIAFIPERIPLNLVPLTDNVLPIEFVIDAGRKCVGKTEEFSTKMRNDLVMIEGFSRVKFGIWLRTMTDSHYTEHVPQ